MAEITVSDGKDLVVNVEPKVVHEQFITIGGQHVKATFDLSELDEHKHQMALSIIKNSGMNVVGYY